MKGCFARSCIGCLGVVAIFGGWVAYGVWPRAVVDGAEPAVRETVARADRIEVLRIESGYPPHGGAPVQAKQLAPPKVADAAFGRRIQAALTSARFWGVFSPKCEPMPGVIFRFHRGPKVVDALFCMSCGALYFYSEGAHTHERYVDDPKRIRALAREAFPKDEELQANSDTADH